MKVINIAAELSSHSSRHPRPYCTPKQAHWDHRIEFGSIPPVEENLFNFFCNCLNTPLLHPNQSILLFCPPPALHIKLGIVNLLVQHLFSLHPHLEVKVAESLGILRKDYHGKSFEGRQCPKLLDKCDALALLVPPECLPVIDCLKAFARVAEATFGYRLSSNYKEIIGLFGE